MVIGAGIFFQSRNGRRDSDSGAADVPDAPDGDSHTGGDGAESMAATSVAAMEEGEEIDAPVYAFAWHPILACG